MLISEGFEGEGKIDNVNELIAGAKEYESRCESVDEEPTLSGFLEEITLVSDVDKYDENADAVVLMTIHAAKGLEFPVVFLAGMEDGIFPSAQNMLMEEEMSEERRLAYVAITRAKNKLYVTYAKNRTMYGKTNYNMLSQFIRKEVPENLIDMEKPMAEPPRVGFSYGQKQKTDTYSQSWREFNRTPDMFRTSVPKKSAATGAAKFGIESFAVGTAVSHAMFGNGVILSAKDMRADVLYEVEFETAGKKKLMATYAKLTKRK